MTVESLGAGVYSISGNNLPSGLLEPFRPVNPDQGWHAESAQTVEPPPVSPNERSGCPCLGGYDKRDHVLPDAKMWTDVGLFGHG